VTTPDEGAQKILAALSAVPGLAVFDSEVPADPPREREDDPSSPVKPYCVLYMGGGTTRSTRLGYRAVDLSLGFQVTYAAGTPRGARWAFAKGRTALVGLRLFDGRQHGRVKEDLEGGEVREDTDVPDDLRWYLPMRYRIATTT
jgi:hypothetical protein